MSSVSIVGCARDCSAHLPDSLRNLEHLGSVFQAVRFVIVENDSTDGTKQILENWRTGDSDRRLVHVMDGLMHCKPRTVRLAIARNVALRMAALACPEADYLIVLDLDDVGTNLLDMTSVEKALAFLDASEERAAVFANQLGYYYDLWALRQQDILGFDLWERVIDLVAETGCDDSAALQSLLPDGGIRIDMHEEPIEVDSAFGGLGIYKMRFARNASYVGAKRKKLTINGQHREIWFQQCEHVPFHNQIRANGGQLWILPWLINGHKDKLMLNPHFGRGLMFE